MAGCGKGGFSMQKLDGKSVAKEVKCSVCLFCIGGFLYNIIEVFWRGYSHWSMFFVGGACFNLIGRIHSFCRRGLFQRCTLCALAVTAVEFISGCLFNLKLKLNVWDYSGMFLNIKGQVCLLYSVLWGFLSLIAAPVYTRCRAKLTAGGREAPQLTVIPGGKLREAEAVEQRAERLAE